MPLLGRHKSLPGSGANQSSGGKSGAPSPTPKQQPPVCESPLFGVRRQLPVAAQQQQPTTADQRHKGSSSATAAASSAMSSSASYSSRLSSAKQQLQHQQSRDGQLGSTLSSIPTQISRQQIHYAYSIMDTNSDGLIDLRDLSQMLANLGVPIDEAILSHVMEPVSKRGDHLISESEFLDWIGNFIQVNDETNCGVGGSNQASNSTTRQQHKTGGQTRARSPVARSASASQSAGSSASASLVAQSPEAEFLINQQMRQRRGSGSGLALVRSLSSSSSPASGGKQTATAQTSGSPNSSSADQHQHQIDELAANSKRERLLQDQQEARRDLKAAFCVFDLDGDGYITIDEVQQGLKLLGESWPQAELSQLFNQCNSNKTKPGALKQRADLSKQRISIDDFVQLLL